MNDPVMGGESYSDLEINTEDGIAKFTGKCAIVPKLKAPGFITMETGSQFYQKPAKFADISTCQGFEFEIKTNTEYNLINTWNSQKLFRALKKKSMS